LRQYLGVLFGTFLDNAIRYTPAGGTVDVQITSAPDAIRVEWRTRGQGFACRPCVRCLTASNRREGTGVPGSGLAVDDRPQPIAKRHQAQITLGDRDGKPGLVVC